MLDFPDHGCEMIGGSAASTVGNLPLDLRALSIASDP